MEIPKIQMSMGLIKKQNIEAKYAVRRNYNKVNLAKVKEQTKRKRSL